MVVPKLVGGPDSALVAEGEGCVRTARVAPAVLSGLARAQHSSPGQLACVRDGLYGFSQAELDGITSAALNPGAKGAGESRALFRGVLVRCGVK